MFTKLKSLLKKIDTIDASTLLAIWVLFSDSTWLVFDIYHNGFNVGYGIVSMMFLLGYIGLFYLFHKHHKALAKPTALRKRVSAQSILLIKQQKEIQELKIEIEELSK